MCIILKANIKLNNNNKIHEVYKESISLIEYNFGELHPLHSNFSSFLAWVLLYQDSTTSRQKSTNKPLSTIKKDSTTA